MLALIQEIIWIIGIMIVSGGGALLFCEVSYRICRGMLYVCDTTRRNKRKSNRRPAAANSRR